MDIKKTWEKLPCLSHSLAFALPFTEISNSASPRHCVLYNLVCHESVHPRRRDTLVAYGNNTPSMDASLRYLLVISKLRSSTIEDNVLKTSFPLPYNEASVGTKPTVCDISRTRNPLCLDPPIHSDRLSQLQS